MLGFQSENIKSLIHQDLNIVLLIHLEISKDIKKGILAKVVIKQDNFVWERKGNIILFLIKFKFNLLTFFKISKFYNNFAHERLNKIFFLW